MKKTLFSLLLVLSIVGLLGTISCGQQAGEGVTQEEYDAIKAQLDAAQAKIAQLEDIPALTVKVPDPALTDEIAKLKTEIEELGQTITALNTQKDNLTLEKSALEEQYALLMTQYEELQNTIEELTTPEIITEEAVENDIFRAINQERVNAGVPELQLGKYLYTQARYNSRDMAATGKFIYDTGVFYQENFWAAGYDSVASITRGALLTFKANQYNYEHGALLINNIYGAVGAWKSGDIFFITFMAAPFQ